MARLFWPSELSTVHVEVETSKSTCRFETVGDRSFRQPPIALGCRLRALSRSARCAPSNTLSSLSFECFCAIARNSTGLLSAHRSSTGVSKELLRQTLYRRVRRDFAPKSHIKRNSRLQS